MKEKARETDDQPAQIIQNAISSTSSSQEVYTYLPSNEALRKSINRIITKQGVVWRWLTLQL